MPRQKSQAKPVCIRSRLDFEIRIHLAVPNALLQTYSSEFDQPMHEACQVVSLNHFLLDCAINVVRGVNERVGACSPEQTDMLNEGGAIVLA